MTTNTVTAVSDPPFPITKPTTASWREQALSRIGEQRFLLSCTDRERVPAEAVAPAVAAAFTLRSIRGTSTLTAFPLPSRS
jgi:hypothetical protein